MYIKADSNMEGARRHTIAVCFTFCCALLRICAFFMDLSLAELALRANRLALFIAFLCFLLIFYDFHVFSMIFHCFSAIFISLFDYFHRLFRGFSVGSSIGFFTDFRQFFSYVRWFFAEFWISHLNAKNTICSEEKEWGG